MKDKNFIRYVNDTCLPDEFFFGASLFGLGMGLGIHWDYAPLVFYSSLMGIVAWIGLKIYRYVQHKEGLNGINITIDK